MSWKYVQRNTETCQYRTTDQGGGGGGSTHTYSTTEQVVGTWIDGKPVYERVIVFQSQITLYQNNWYSTSILSSDFDIIIDCVSLEFKPNSQSAIAIRMVEADISTTNLKLISTRNGNDYIDAIILRYTKPTS